MKVCPCIDFFTDGSSNVEAFSIEVSLDKEVVCQELSWYKYAVEKFSAGHQFGDFLTFFSLVKAIFDFHMEGHVQQVLSDFVSNAINGGVFA